MTKKHGRAEIRFKLEHDLYDAAEEAFREAGLSIETGLTLFLAQVAKQHISRARWLTSRMMFSRQLMN